MTRDTRLVAELLRSLPAPTDGSPSPAKMAELLDALADHDFDLMQAIAKLDHVD